jgi:hypothetical protein
MAVALPGENPPAKDASRSNFYQRMIYTSLKSPSMTSSFAEEELPAALPVPA